MPLIGNPTDVMMDLGYDTSMTNISLAAASAMRAATASLASALQTDFDQGQMVDTFYLERPTDVRHRWSFRSEFRLTQAFVNAAPPIAAVWAENATALQSSLGTTDVSAALTVNLEKGVAVDILNNYRRAWVRISYTKGFPLNQSDNTMFDLTVVPQWLQEAATLLCKISLQSNPSLEDPAIKLDTKMLQAQLSGILKPHLRYTPSAELAVFTETFGMPEQATATAPAALPVDGGLLLAEPFDELGY